MLMGAGWELFNRICFNYPTLGVLYQRAAYDAAMAELASGGPERAE
jgi:NAD(P) transhydrogenase